MTAGVIVTNYSYAPAFEGVQNLFGSAIETPKWDLQFVSIAAQKQIRPVLEICRLDLLNAHALCSHPPFEWIEGRQNNVVVSQFYFVRLIGLFYDLGSQKAHQCGQHCGGYQKRHPPEAIHIEAGY